MTTFGKTDYNENTSNNDNLPYIENNAMRTLSTMKTLVILTTLLTLLAMKTLLTMKTFPTVTTPEYGLHDGLLILTMLYRPQVTYNNHHPRVKYIKCLLYSYSVL